MFRAYADFTKLGIVIFVLLSGIAGYGTGFSLESSFSANHFLVFLLGLYCLSSGSLALNQLQEVEKDRKMPRTEKRPLVSGKLSIKMGWLIAVALLTVGTWALYVSSPLAAALGALTVFLYNVTYVYWWKPKWIFGAVPGAIPGALPVTIGFAANSSDIFRADSVYLFLILFLWQMPHFWALALKFKEDYRQAGVPTLPTVLGVPATLYQIGLYTFLYVALAVGSPWFVHASWIYVAFVIPVSVKLLHEFYRFHRAQGEKHWLSFFMWINVSVLIYLAVPVIDRWNFLFIDSN